MQPLDSPSLAKPSTLTDQEDAIRHLTAEAQVAYRRFQTTGDVVALDPVILAILEDFIPRKSQRSLADLPGDTRLMDDLGYDSLAITEVVFFTEDLFRIRIANEEIIQVRTLDDLRGFVRRKISEHPAD